MEMKMRRRNEKKTIAATVGVMKKLPFDDLATEGTSVHEGV